MTRSAIKTPNAPAAVGPYSQAIVAGDFVFTAGQVGLDPATGTLVDGIEAQAEQVLRNIEAVLAAAGLSMADVVKTTVLLADMADFATVNTIYARHMPDPPPARSTFAVAGLPRAARIEIEAVARRPG
jgi:2-iminobutanoate/2-iminopropanoate deaminase